MTTFEEAEYALTYTNKFIGKVCTRYFADRDEMEWQYRVLDKNPRMENICKFVVHRKSSSVITFVGM